MKKFLWITGLIFLLCGNVYSKNTKLIKDNSYDNNIKWKFLEFNLPEGEWKLAEKSYWSVSTISIDCINFIQTENNIWKASYDICQIKNGGKHAQLLGAWLISYLKNDKYDNCTLRPEYFYAKLYTKGMTMNCFRARHFDVYNEIYNPEDPYARGSYANFKRYINEYQITLPKTALGSTHLFYSPSIRDKGIEISHLINPEFYGAPKTLFAIETKSEYHRENIKNYPKKLKFFSEWTKQKVNFHKEFEKKMKAKRRQKLNFDDLEIF